LLEIPPEFLERMRDLLSDEFPAFATCLTQPPCVGLRLNTLKITPPEFSRLSPFTLDPIPWIDSGYCLSADLQPGKHPYHTAGLYYLQEPAAMAAGVLLEPRPGDRVLDLAAAPGGKTTHLAALMNNRGLLVANEIHPKRVWDLAQNLERCGVRNVVLLNESPERLASHFGPYFDRVLLDAPCSGEGMFRKNPSARSEWSLELVRGSARRQVAILAQAAGLVKPGGRLVYSTCTFSPEENECVVANFLSQHTDFELVEPARQPGFSPGCPDWLTSEKDAQLHRAVRIWPHHAPAEGHFFAVFFRHGTPAFRKLAKFRVLPPKGRANDDFQAFIQENLVHLPGEPCFHLQGSYIYQLRPGVPDLSGLRVIHPGWWLGILKKNRFEPSHALALGMTVDQVHRVVNLPGMKSGEGCLQQAEAYLRGENLDLAELPHPGESFKTHGWALVAVDGHPIGWGKSVDRVIKNHYPRGLRWF
jgi:NOL1/NOP2/sun family putative RNA methylase